ncbi:hypothetical protein [Herminiimonas sp. CN]|uniref:hypothetical protein n=1 Tax=Herminiimonas sp. CN TaxID=1349818 RepID=UPI0004732B2B|nr:hypothetical protein [Herminiimonas sp. CN]
MTVELDLSIRQGATYRHIVRWETQLIAYKPITDVTQTAPVVVTATGHGIPDGWKAAVVSVKGMTQINAATPPKKADYRPVTVLSADSIALNDVNAASFAPYASGGYLRFYTPADLAGFTARMSIKDRIGGTELISLTDANARIVLDDAAKTITLLLSATDTASFAWANGVYDLELVSVAGEVTTLLSGAVSIIKEVTTTP